jgi:starch synthase
VIPFHGVIHENGFNPEFLFEFEVPAKNGLIQAQAYQLVVNGVHTYLIAGSPIGEDSSVYSLDATIDGPKYIFFSMAVLEFIKKLDWQPNILHANDWLTALSVYALSFKRPLDPFSRMSAQCLPSITCHFMGWGTKPPLMLLAYYLPVITAALVGQEAPMPMGLQAADQIVAVSATYAEEIMTQNTAAGLRHFPGPAGLDYRILNGIDQENWDPAKDANLQ